MPECEEEFTLTTSVTPDYAGTVSPASGDFESGTQVTLTAQVNPSHSEGYVFSHWTGDVSGSEPTISFEIESDTFVTAEFIKVCDGENPPLYCECEDTGNPVLDNRSLQMVFKDLWNKQLSTDKEQGGFLYKNALGDWQFFELTGDWVEVRTIDRLIFYVPSSLPEGSIYIHTHPVQSALTRFGITSEYQHKPSRPDRAAMVRMSSKHGVAHGVIIDPVYRILVGPDGKVITKETRCGY